MDDPSLPSGASTKPSPYEPLAVAQARARAWGALFEGRTQSGMRMGRYVLLEELGAGAMGLVYAAYDPELDRKVAIKVLRGLPSQHDAGEAARLVREARALAKLSHPNVVAVHDVGLVEPEGTARGGATVFLAMEHVRGTTLRRWLAAERRPWRELVAMLEQAGRGLAAAHEVGLVHRDFKPDNVMVGEDGRARVMDFGLARPLERVPETEEEPRLGTLPASDERTQTGMVVGTPAYMAPEQHWGRAVDARSDQFAFCVTAWEALIGRRPFALRPGPAMTKAFEHPPEDPRPGDPPVPAWVLAVLRRGLAIDPAARHPDMHALLAALADDPARRRRRRLGLGALVGVLALGGAGFTWERRQRERACEEAGAAIAEVWNDQARAEVEAAIDLTALSYAADTRARVVEGLDAHASGWAAAREQSCRAHVVERRVDAAQAARTDACLADGRDALASWIELVRTAEPEEVASLTEATAELPSIEACLDPVWLARRPIPPDDPDARARGQDLQRRLTRARGLWRLRRYDESLREAEAIEAEAEAEGMTRLRAQAALQVASSAFRTGEPDGARAARERALASALGIGDDELAIEALAELVVSDATDGRVDRARAWLSTARALLPRVEPEPGLLTTAVLDAGGVAAFMAGSDREAKEQHEQALAIAERILPAAHPWLTRSLNNLGGVQQRQGEVDSALAALERVVEIRTHALGPTHPQVGSALGNLGSLYGTAGRLEESEATLARALALLEQAYGPDHERVGTMLINLGVARVHRGGARAGVPLLERAVTVLERAHGSEHPQVARALSALGMALLDVSEPARAVELLQRALAVQERVHGPEHPSVAVTLGTLGTALREVGRLEESDAAQRRALALRETLLPPEHPDTAVARLELARTLTLQGRTDEALAEAGRALTVLERADANNAASAHLGMAAALVAAGRLDEALERGQRSLDVAEAADRDTLRASAWGGIATVHEQGGRWDEALAAFERAERFGTAAYGPDEPALADAKLGLAVASRARGELEAARAHAERALALRTSSSSAPWQIAEAELVLAEILAADPSADRSEHARARELAQRACAAPRAAGMLRLRACDREPGRPALDVLASR